MSNLENFISNKKYLFSILILVIVGSLGSFYFVKSQSASRLSDHLEVLGGAVINGQGAEDALVIMTGQSGFNVENPDRVLDVAGDPRFLGTDFIFDDSSNPNVLTVPTEIETTKLETETIVHSEQGVTIQYSNGSTNCESCSNISATDKKVWPTIMSFLNIPTANAAPECYADCNPVDAEECQVKYGADWSEDETQRITESVIYNTCGALPNQCSYPSDPEDYGTYIRRRTCRGPAGAVAEAVKIEFLYDETPGVADNSTRVHDNFQSVDNTPESCGFEAGPICGNGKFMAGYNAGVGIYCCEL